MKVFVWVCALLIAAQTYQFVLVHIYCLKKDLSWSEITHLFSKVLYRLSLVLTKVEGETLSSKTFLDLSAIQSSFAAMRFRKFAGRKKGQKSKEETSLFCRHLLGSKYQCPHPPPPSHSHKLKSFFFQSFCRRQLLLFIPFCPAVSHLQTSLNVGVIELNKKVFFA